MKRLAVLAAVVLLLLAAFAAFAPATLLDARLDAATQGHLRLADASGTVWSGPRASHRRPSHVVACR